MAKENEITRTNRDVWLENMRKKYPDIQDEDALYEASMNGYDQEHEALKKHKEQLQQLKEILSANPSLNDVFVEIYERGKEGHPELALRQLPDELKRYVSDPNYGDEEYLAAKKAREDEAAANEAEAARINELHEQAFAEVLAEEKIEDAEAVLQKIKDFLQSPCKTLEECKERARGFIKMITYDDAVAASEIRGKNAKIVEQKRNHPAGIDTLPRNGGSSAAANAPKKQRSFFDYAEAAS